MTNSVISFNGQYKFLSNFHSSQIEFEGLVYPTVEHAYQAAKTLDNIVREFIRNQVTPGEAKRAGRNISLREDWEDVKLTIMATLLRKKFYDPVLKAALLQTGEAELKELNYWHDQFWGSCTCLKHNDTGDNNLGRLLMELREELRVPLLP